MNLSKSLAEFYETIFKLAGPKEARKATSAAISNVIFELQEEGIPVSEESLSKKLQEYAADFIEASKNKAA